ncbi:MAG: peptidylprolyl isomerase [Chitinophagales bacterium]
MLISKIRKYSWFAVGAIALCLIAFLVQDATNSNTGLFSKNKAPAFAAIGDEEISPDAFDARKREAFTEYLVFNNLFLQYQQGQYQIDQKTNFNIGEQAWTSFVNETLVDQQLEKLGITLTDQEFTDIIYGPDPHPVIKSYYGSLAQMGYTLPQFVEMIKDQNNQQQNPQYIQEYFNFISREQVAKREYLQEKYLDLFTKSAYVPEWMVKHNYNTTNSKKDFTYVFLPYTNIVDSTIEVTDSDLKKYFNEHKNKYKQTEGRVLDYVSWEFLPTAQDSANTVKALMESVEKMKNAKNDSTYIATRSEDQDRFGFSYFTRSDLYADGVDTTVVDSMFSKPVGSLVGPFHKQTYYSVAKINTREVLPDSVDARHILIAVNDTRDSVAAKALADSIKNVISGGADFAEMAGKYSDDGGSKDGGGDLGWSTPSINFVPEFKNYLFHTGQVGKLGIVRTDYGYHIIEIKEIKNRKEFVNISYLSKSITAGKETIDSIEKMSGNFYNAYQTPESFDEGVKAMRLFKRSTQPLVKNAFEISGIPNSREIITWAFNANKGDFKYFNMSDRVVVAYVKEVKVDGIPELENVRDQVELEVIREKKGEMLKAQAADAMKGASSLEAIAGKLQVKVDSVRSSSLSSPYAPGVGLEPKLVGTIFGLETGKISEPVAGNRGVYIAQAGNYTAPAETDDYTLNRNQLTYSLTTKFQGQQGGSPLLKELKDKAGVIDNRYYFND